jgi:Tol biopolymer transport system component
VNRLSLRCLALVLTSALPLSARAQAPASPSSQPQAPVKDTGKPEEKKPEEKWDVNAPGFPATQVDLDVTEGTWMSLDVSPKGDELAFDLLGDIYVLPLAGGEAKALTSGVAWDMQPRYSPDGRSIAFTSDRGGGDNIWVMKREGSEPTAVTQEKFRLLNSPTWSPDGQFIVARKHFTSRRSLGAGEMWMYHRAGGEGVQLTERPNDQKDVGEPAFSPDGRYLYYSQDITPGKVFDYNKDPNGEIYVIQRLDLETRETERYVTGPGGSIRPTPSPDGKSLAFIRRVRGKSTLFVADVASGLERPLFDGLERDMQETWAIHGVYPAMAWTPDNKSLVFWAGGKLQRIDVATKKVTPIPFRVRATRTIHEAARFPQPVGPDQFQVKMLRWVQVSPKGDKAVYQALGHLYVRDLPSGTPKRLTKQTEHVELYPSFSRDGKSIVYTTWDDEQLGTLRVVPVTGGEGKVVSAKPGHYVEPAFSPDGKSLVYRAIGGGYLRSGLYSREQGLFVIPASGGPARRLVKDGEQPHFGASSERVYFLTVEQKEKDEERALKSIRLDGGEQRRSTRCRRTRSGWRSGRTSTRTSSRCRVGPRARWPAPRRRRCRWPGCRATRARGCTGRAMASGCTGRWGPSCTRGT